MDTYFPKIDSLSRFTSVSTRNGISFRRLEESESEYTCSSNKSQKSSILERGTPVFKKAVNTLMQHTLFHKQFLSAPRAE